MTNRDRAEEIVSAFKLEGPWRDNLVTSIVFALDSAEQRGSDNPRPFSRVSARNDPHDDTQGMAARVMCDRVTEGGEG